MKYALVIDPSVVHEVHGIHTYRERERKGSGDRFLKALEQCYDRILANPGAYQIRKGNFRHAIVDKLKYRVVYRFEGINVYIMQVRHTSRRPSKKFGP